MTHDAEKSEKEPWEKKSERFEVRLPFSKKQAFLDACEQQGDTPSEAVRRFIHTYLRRSREDNFGMVRRSLRIKVRQNWVFGVSGVVAIGAMSILGPQGCASIKAEQVEKQRQSLFAAYDKDESGVIELGEVSVNDFELHKVLDIDDSQTISIDEFIVKGRMQIQESHLQSQALHQKTESTRRLIVFDLSNQNQVQLSAWEIASNSLADNDKMDRLVYRDTQSGKFKYLLADTTLSFDDGEFESITFDWVETKKTKGFSWKKRTKQ